MTDVAEPLWRDDPSIGDQNGLWRRIPGWHFVWDANRNSVRPSSAAFDNDPDGGPMSVQLAEELRRHGLGAEAVLAGHRGFSVAELTAGAARSCRQGVMRDPQPEEPAHAVVFGDKPERCRKALARASTWRIDPPVLYLGEGCVLFEGSRGHPCVRRSDGRWERVRPGAPAAAGWLVTPRERLAAMESAESPLREAVSRAIALWSAAPL